MDYSSLNEKKLYFLYNFMLKVDILNHPIYIVNVLDSRD